MTKRLGRIVATISCLAMLAGALGGCTKCGWIWDSGSHSCHSDHVE
jgi:hypothetical protein